jgi:hypothetical protein
MKKLLASVVGLSLLFFYTVPLLACDCDTAMAILQGVPDRLHRPWPGDPQRAEGKVKSNEVPGPRQEAGPMNMNQDAKPQGEVKR